MSLQDVKLALQRNWYLPTQLLSSYAVAKENVAFTPTDNAAYVRLTFAPNQPRAISMGGMSTGTDIVTGNFVVEMFYPSQTGDAQACVDFETVRTRYASGKNLLHNSQSVQIMSCGRTSGSIVDTSWFRVRINVEWRAQTLR